MKRNRGATRPPRRHREGLGALLRAFALSALLVASQVLGLFGSALAPEAAYAATPVPDSVTITGVEPYSSGVGMWPSHKFVNDSGVTTYCADCDLSTPRVGQTFSGRVAGGLTLDYILYYGYGGTGYTGSVQGYTGEDAQAVTQLAVWFVLTEHTPSEVYNRKLASAGLAFMHEAQANASSDAGYAGTSWIYGQNTGTTQRVVGQTIRLFDPIWFVVQKVDSQGAQVSDWDAQGNATTEGAQFTINFYEGTLVNSVDQLPSSPNRTWVIQTKKGTNGKVRAALSDQYKVSGDDWYYDDNGTVSLPVGSFTVQETKAPEGYLMSDTSVHLGQVKASDDGYAKIERIGGWTSTFDQQDAGAGLAVADDVVRGGASFAKVDAERDAAVPQGDATLAGAEITITNASANAVQVDGTWYQPGEDVMTLTTGEDGTAQTAADALPYGSYTARETKASRGYLLNLSWSKSFTISEQGAVVDCTDSPVEQQVIRGDLSAVKADEDTMERMAGVPFLVTSETTGEWHVVVTDENGMLDTSSDWNAHSQRTNASDAAYDPATGSVDDSKLDPTAGVWFSGNADGATPVDDSLGALPYDTYSVQELRSEANEGHNLAHFSVTVTRHGVDLHMGTVDDSTVAIGTTLTDAEGEKCVPASASTRLVDEVSYQGLTAGATYTLEGELHVVNADGTDGGVVATASTDFKAGTKIGTTEQAFDVDTTQLGGRSLVAFETVRDASGQEVASHADLSDEGQTVTVPAIHTTLQGDAGHESAATSHLTLTDTVEYSGLTPGKSYTATGTLHLVNDDGTDGGEIKDSDGADVTASATFTPDAADGSVEVTFDFDAPDLAGKTVVAFEDVSHNGITYATHADVTDEGQTVRFPSVHTTATADATGDHELPAASGQKVTDTVHMENLTAGHEYVVTGTLHTVNDDGSDGGALKDADGADVTATTTFTAEAATQDVEVAFDVDASGLAGRTVVAFEDLSTGGVTIATHADIADQGQTLRVPAIHTTATDKADGDHEVAATQTQTVVDRVEYANLVPGKEYVVTGTLHLVNDDGTDAGVLSDASGNKVTVTKTFTPDTPDGYVDVEFTFDATGLAGRKVVAFEDLSTAGTTIATHADITDEGQTVTVETSHQGGSSSYPNTGQGPTAAILTAAGLTAVCAAGIRAACRRRKAAPNEPETK